MHQSDAAYLAKAISWRHSWWGGSSKTRKSMGLLSAPSSSILGQDPSMLYFDRLEAMGPTEPDPLAPSPFRLNADVL